MPAYQLESLPSPQFRYDHLIRVDRVPCFFQKRFVQYGFDQWDNVTMCHGDVFDVMNLVRSNSSRRQQPIHYFRSISKFEDAARCKGVSPKLVLDSLDVSIANPMNPDSSTSISSRFESPATTLPLGDVPTYTM